MQATDKANRLINEKSPYLLQHAHNPVDWFPWGEKAFEKARREDKLVFLSVGYSTCHWCHVMEREVFEDSGCAALLNADFVSIKVDREERPDVDNIYMEACQSMTGSGGWPLSVFLTPDKLPFFAGTYIPKDHFKSLLLQLSGLWNSNRKKIKSAAAEITKHLNREHDGGASLSDDAPAAAYESLKRRFDFKHGGFGGAPKFPSAHTLMFLMRYGVYYRKPDAIRMADFTMEKMAQGGIFDHIGGGFCRYSTDKYFLIPHFEKMLYDNAMLALVYSEARRFAAARRALDYCIAEMRDSLGGFYTAQDADSEGVEGKFYSFSPAEVYSVLGDKDGSRFCGLYDISEKGNFEGKSIPNLLVSGNLALSDEEFSNVCRVKLYEYRSKRVPPLKDDKVLVSSNGLMIAALSTAGRMMRDSGYIEHAKAAARFILGNMQSGDRLYSVWRGERLPHKATLDDYAYLAWGLFRLHQATLEKEWLDAVITLCSDIERLFSDDSGMFCYTGSDIEDLPVRLKSGFDGALPSGNSIAAGVFLRLWQLTGDEHYMNVYNGIVNALAGDAEKYPTAFCSLFSSFMLCEHGGAKVEIHGEKEQYSSAMAHFRPFVSWTAADGGDTGAHVCHGGACRPPVSSPEELDELLKVL